MSVYLFISVSDEFARDRDPLRVALTRHDVAVRPAGDDGDAASRGVAGSVGVGGRGVSGQSAGRRVLGSCRRFVVSPRRDPRFRRDDTGWLGRPICS